MKCIFKAFLLSFLIIPMYARENYQQKYLELLHQGKYEELAVLLQDWEKQSPGNVEVHIAYFNYYSNKGREIIPTIGRMSDGRYGSFPAVQYREPEASLAISYIDKALKTAPDRMDVYLGKCSVMTQMRHYESVKDTLIAMLERNEKNHGIWYWSNNIRVEQAGFTANERIVDSVNDYVGRLFPFFEYTGSFILQICEKALTYFPDNVIFLNLLAHYYARIGNYVRANEILFRAQKIDPGDYIIVANIALNYELQGDYKNARIWYEKLLTFTIPEAKQFAEEGLQNIRKAEGR